jgi:hypothetical protein
MGKLQMRILDADFYWMLNWKNIISREDSNVV